MDLRLMRCASRAAPLCWSLLGCAAGGGRADGESQSPEGRECSVRLAARGQLAAAPPGEPSPQTPLSRIVAHVGLPLRELSGSLEGRIPQRLAEARGVGTGLAGVINYSVTRGPLSLSVSDLRLVVQAPVRAHAEACSRGRCYASCEPEALVRVEVPLTLRPDYRFEPSQVSASFTRGCKVRALGGLLTVDVTPTLKAQLLPELAKVARAIDQQLPDVRAEAEKAWRELSKARPLPLGGCVVLQPTSIVQGPTADSSEAIQARFALLASPEVRTRCGEPPSPLPLPSLRSDPSLPDQGRVTLGMVMPIESLERAFEAAGPLELPSAPRASAHSPMVHLRVARASVVSAGRRVDADLTLEGGACGSVGLRANLDFSGEGHFIRLGQSELSAGERERLERGSLSPSTLVRALAGAPRVLPPLSVAGLRDAAPALVASLSQDSVEVSAKVKSVRAAGASARGPDFVAWIEAEGALYIKRR